MAQKNTGRCSIAEKVRIVEYLCATVGHTSGEGRRLLEHLSEKGVKVKPGDFDRAASALGL